MPRDVYEKTMAITDGAGNVKALAGIRVTVYLAGTNTIATIFRARTGVAEGPALESGASGGPNPFVTGSSGAVEFWAEGPVEYDVQVEDTVAPARIATRRRGWNALPAAAESFPTAMLQNDGNLDVGTLGPDVTRQMVPIGGVIPWWRPSSAVALPSGFEIADGRSIAAGDHDFGTGSSINVPDLRNRFIIGADHTKAHATGANQGDAATDAPGIAGTGGSNTAKTLSHTHGIPDHSHAGSTAPAGSHNHGGLTGGSDRSLAHTHSMAADGRYVPGSSMNVNPAFFKAGYGSLGGIPVLGVDTNAVIVNLTATASGSTPDHLHSITTAANHSHTVALGGGSDASTNPQTVNTNWTANPGSDFRPRFIGLLYIIKVRRA